MRTNLKLKITEYTHEGAPAFAHMAPEQALRRSVLSCLLWEREFYEEGEAIADRITALAAKISPETLAVLAIEARNRFHLRHVPLLLLTVLAKTGAGSSLVSDTVVRVVQRADELGELIALYWRAGKKPLPAQFKKGLARAFAKFDAYHLAKYDRDAAVKLRDVMFLVHPNPRRHRPVETDAEITAEAIASGRETLYRKLAQREIEAPDTWEVALSGGADKRETFERLLRDGKLGYLALLRNLRNMAQAGCDVGLVRDAILARKGARHVLPFRYVAAARAAPQFEPALDAALQLAIGEMPVLAGKTAVMVDVSGSMDERLSARSDLTRKDAAAALAAMVPGDVRMFSFADQVIEVPPRRGMAGVDALVRSQSGGTRLFDAVAAINANVPYDRLIVITDEQATDPSRFGHWIQGTSRNLDPPKGIGYMVNVASAKNGIGYGPWVHIDGFSEAVFAFIREHEAART